MGVPHSRSRLIIPKLPPELYQAITDEVDSQSDLLTLLRVSINFNSAVERRLYNTISLNGKPPPSEAAQKKKLRVFERIITCPRVAAYVFHLTIILYTWPLPSSYTSSYFAKLFLSVPNLKSLCIYPLHQIIHGLQGRLPFLLRTFEHSGTGHDWDPSFTPIVKAFLEAQVELEELISWGIDFNNIVTLTPSALPKLTTVSCRAEFVRKLLPGRPVTRVHYCLQEEEASPISASPIQSLYVTGLTAEFQSNLKWYISLSPTLTFLSCTVSASHYSGDEYLIHFLGCCLRLKRLQVFIDTEHSSPWWLTDEEKLAFVNSIFASCPSLCSIELYNPAEAYESGNYTQSMMWMRGSQTGTPSLWDWYEWRKR